MEGVVVRVVVYGGVMKHYGALRGKGRVFANVAFSHANSLYPPRGPH